MSARTMLRQRAAQARRRVFADTACVGVPLVAAFAGVAALRGAGVLAWTLPALAGLACVALLAAWRARPFDLRWAARQLDARRRDMDDSAALLLAEPRTLAPLQQLQRSRLEQRLAAAPAPELAPPWSGRAMVVAAAAALLALLAAYAWPARQVAQESAPARGGDAAPAAVPGLVARELRIEPPAYTGLPARTQGELDVRAPQGSRLHWALRFSPQPDAVELAFLDGTRLPLQREGADWSASMPLRASALYRVVVAGATPDPRARPQRLVAIADAPPQVRAVEPEHSPVLRVAGQGAWTPVFEASDDYGLAGDARLEITLAQGSGENVSFREQSIGVRGRGSATTRRYAPHLDLAALGMQPGDDLVVRLEVRDNRVPGPQRARGPALVLRWPAQLDAAAEGLELAMRTVLPAYFRSQRQIIIDAEALQKQKPRLDPERFTTRADAIGVDQRILRLRYGQFLGEEAEGAPRAPAPADEATHAHEGEDAHGHADATAGVDATAGTDAHAHADAAPAREDGFGAAVDVLQSFGHTHDHAEAATLLDPETRATLKLALDRMWQSELQLRQGRPDLALPHAYKALEYIKQVQQAERVYLARVGPELPPIDQSRRLGGDRDGFAARALPLAMAGGGEPVPLAAWRALADDSPAPPDLDALQGWLGANASRLDDPLDFAAALDAVALQPECAGCRRELRALLWTVLARPPAAVPRRDPPDAAGARYLDALRREAEARR